MKSPRFLVVDDEAVNLIVIKAILEAEGCEVIVEASGVEALERCRTGDCAFDMVLLDVHMPQLSGLETALRMRRIEEMAEVPIVFVSARATQTDQEAGLAAGGNYYLTKPFRRKDLLSAIARFLPGLSPAS